jgi:copper transport protein
METHGRDALLAIADWVAAFGALVVSGGVVFRSFIWRRAGPVAARPAWVDAAFLRRWQAAVAAAWAGALGASCVAFAVRDGTLGVDAFRVGVLLGAMPWALASAPAMVLATVPGPSAGEAPPRTNVVHDAVIAVALVLATALAGHARLRPPVVPNVSVAVIHVSAAAVWVGGLVLLLAAAYPATRPMGRTGRVRILAAVVARFSDLAVVAVLALVATGTYSSIRAVGRIDRLTATSYGVVLLAKLGAFAVTLALGGVNNRWTKPRLAEAAERGDGETSSLPMLHRLVALEVGLLALVVALSAILLGIDPPASVPD